MGAPSIADHALIGNGLTLALIARGGALDWLCWPAPDAPACFAAILGTPAQGHWTIEAPGAASRRCYRPGTLALEEVFTTPGGEAARIDFAPPGRAGILRLVEGRAGRVAMRHVIAPRFDYGALAVPAAAISGGLAFGARGRLYSSLPLSGDGDAVFELAAGERHWFAWGEMPSADPWALLPTDTGEAVSVRVLRALCLAGGAMLAAPTTSLPERIGGARNWDYRFCWLRDSALAARALLRAGRREEAAAWRDWLRRTVDPARPRTLYPATPSGDVRERTLAWLPGHRGSAPVRVGNAAVGQLQIDAIGAVIDTLADLRDAGLAEAAGQWAWECALLAHLRTIWPQPDEGIWEIRGPRRHFTHSKAMAWRAFARAVAGAGRHRLDGPLEVWRADRDALHRLILTRGMDASGRYFTAHFGGEALDASLLLLSAIGFLPADDARLRATTDAIAARLLRYGVLLRYDADDGLPPGEGAFLPCSFWLADAWARGGRRAQARALLADLRLRANDLGLFAEESDPATGAALGNFPQAFTHIALLDSQALLDAAIPPAPLAAGGGTAAGDR